MDRARDLQQARRIEAAANLRALEHITECGNCYDDAMQGIAPGADCGAYQLLLDQAGVAADAVDAAAAATAKEVN